MYACPQNRPTGLLVVHEDPRVLSVLCALLKMEGFVTTRGGNAHAAVTALREHPGQIDAALIDADTPAGVEAWRALRTAAPWLRCWLLRRDSGGLPGEGAEGVVAKPFTLAALRSCLDAVRRPDPVTQAG
jgi:DNA-binding response OmpR family regulator